MTRQNALTRYYVNQAGSGMSQFYSGSSYQKGAGIGSFLFGLVRRALPFLRSGAETLGKEAARTGAHILSDIASGQNARESFKRHAAEASGNLVNSLKRKADDMLGSGIKRRRIQQTTHLEPDVRRVRTSRKKTKAYTDIYSE